MKHSAIKAQEGVVVQLQVYLALVLDGGKWSAGHLGKAPGTHWQGLDTVKRKNLLPLPRV